MPAEDRSTVRGLIAAFLADLAHANRSAHTRYAYAADLAQFAAQAPSAVEALTPEVLRAFFATLTHLSPAGRARKQAALASFLSWAVRQEVLAANPMDRIERVKPDPPQVRGRERGQIEAILTQIPRSRLRDRVLFRLIVETGVRIGEALALQVEDLDLTLDDEHIRVVGKGNRRRTVLLDDSRLVADLRTYLRRTGYQHGALFRAEKNYQGGPLRYQSVHVRWAAYCRQAEVACTLHQLRHSHATELVNAGVSLATIRKRLGHQNIQTTLRYAEQSDSTADSEIRRWRREQTQKS
ncbi:MAG: tyrosine-type recombinase/integrase [Chloroflexota bacterium]|nr:tyrosine-type recombinase/integrase [Chloroflexota bacterium]